MSFIESMIVDECLTNEPMVAIPRPEVHLVVRVGASAQRGLDMHVLGARRYVTRKTIRKGQMTVVARLQLGTAAAVLGMPASAVSGLIVPVEDVWGASEARAIYDQLASAASPNDAARILERAIAGRYLPDRPPPGDRTLLVREAARQLLDANVYEVAAGLGISERHLRRVFIEAVGMSPKMFSRLRRFSRATDLARADRRTNWASIAAEAGFYDQAHLIEEFRHFTGVTPEAFIHEISVAHDRKGADSYTAP
ncbi:AraC family transcriptional regulator [Bordetella genomosp. 9]|uniref:AraC family transcriptional regulator n=1 Tax=Bordetella genomosp. 9 TaxID=1416803 RepID=A0A261R8R6_9BORD|nr:helix-turn-helix domain-containing protein [Bordetella genomosp. 9]OZI21398.1 AraC family transcriptional regulator [Bordetella genomosp. 9]